MVEISRIDHEQYVMQSSILTALAESNQDTILDNTDLIESLKISKTKSVEIEASLQRSEEIEKTIEVKRNEYRPISIRGSIMYFVIASLSDIDPMYQYSLDYVKKIFNETIMKILLKIQE